MHTTRMSDKELKAAEIIPRALRGELTSVDAAQLLDTTDRTDRTHIAHQHFAVTERDQFYILRVVALPQLDLFFRFIFFSGYFNH